MVDLLHGKLQLDVVTPSARLISIACDEVRAPGSDGGFGVRPGHAPLMSGLDAGVLTYVVDGVDHSYALAGGFIEVAENRVTVLADYAEPVASIDPVAAQAELAAAAARLRQVAEQDEAAFRREEAAVRQATAKVTATRPLR
jgi:F-type H+-transporting ATPase subunit epsilon